MAFRIPVADVEREVPKNGDRYEFVFNSRWELPEFALGNVRENIKDKAQHFSVDRIYKNEETGQLHVLTTVKIGDEPSLQKGSFLITFGIVFGVIIGLGSVLTYLFGLQLDKVYKIIESPTGSTIASGLVIVGIIIAVKLL